MKYECPHFNKFIVSDQNIHIIGLSDSLESSTEKKGPILFSVTQISRRGKLCFCFLQPRPSVYHFGKHTYDKD